MVVDCLRDMDNQQGDGGVDQDFVNLAEQLAVPIGSAGSWRPHNRSTQPLFARPDTAISPVSGRAINAV